VVGSSVRTRGGSTRSWRVREWPTDPTVAHLIFVDHHHVPTPSEITAATKHALRNGAQAVRTSALFPRAAEVVVSAGFEPIDHLALMRRPLDSDFDRTNTRSTPLRAWHMRAAARVDQDAFGSMWGNTAGSLAEVRRATPIFRARLVRDRQTAIGFAISGAAGVTGYIQRVAVITAHRRQGVARDLVVDALIWMRARGLTQSMVNTGTGNEAALALYKGLGFIALADQLTVAEFRPRR
jgi:ribosomal protein S18 acetylase RimI-like enzyme